MSPILHRSILIIWTIATFIVFANAVQLLDYAIQFLRNYPDKYPLPALPSFIVVSHAFFILAMIAHLMVFGASLMAEQTDLSLVGSHSRVGRSCCRPWTVKLSTRAGLARRTDYHSY